MVPHPLVAAGMLIAILLILILPRKKAITPFLLAFLTIHPAQVLVLGGVHLLMHQILILTVLVLARPPFEDRLRKGGSRGDSPPWTGW